MYKIVVVFFFFSSRRRHTRSKRDWSSDVCSSDLYSIFVAEVASTTNEALLSDYLLNNLTDEKERLYVLNYFLEGFRATVFRQTMFAEFEHDIHVRAQNGEALTAEKLTEI